jgi:dihydroflavonol-4-reductase
MKTISKNLTLVDKSIRKRQKVYPIKKNCTSHVLVTGADGMLGSNLVRLLLKKEFRVSAFLHPSSASSTLEGLPIKKHYGDILNKESLDQAMAGKDIIIHAASLVSVWPHRSEFVRRVNIEGTRNVIEIALKHQIERTIYIGSAGSMVTSGKYKYPGEKYGLDYIDSKYEALKIVLHAVKEKGLPALAILPTFMIGPYDSQPSSGKLIVSQAKGKLYFCPGGGRNFVNVSDVSAAIVNSLEFGEIGKSYVAGNENLTYKAFLTKVACVTGRCAPIAKSPGWIVKLIGWFLGLQGRLLHVDPTVSYVTARISCDHHYVSSEDAVTELNMPQTNIETAIKKSYNWLQTNGYID